MEAIRSAQRVYEFNSHLLAAQMTRQITGTPAALAHTAPGYLTLALAAINEAEAHRLILVPAVFRIADLVSVEFEVACTAALDAGTEVAFGLCATVNDDPDLIDQGIWFRVLDTNVVVAESDDNAGNDIDDVATGMAAGLAFRNYVINFRDGVWLGDPRVGGSVGGSGKIELAIENAQGLLSPVARGTQFRLDTAVGPLTPFIQITKGVAVTVGSVFIRHLRIRMRNQALAAV
jgi:hypothetical protein